MLNKSFSELYSQPIAIEEYLLNETCILQKEVYTNHNKMK